MSGRLFPCQGSRIIHYTCIYYSWQTLTWLSDTSPVTPPEVISMARVLYKHPAVGTPHGQDTQRYVRTAFFLLGLPLGL